MLYPIPLGSHFIPFQLTFSSTLCCESQNLSSLAYMELTFSWDWTGEHRIKRILIKIKLKILLFNGRVTGRLFYTQVERKGLSEDFVFNLKLSSAYPFKIQGKRFLAEESESGKGYDCNSKRKRPVWWQHRKKKGEYGRR